MPFNQSIETEQTNLNNQNAGKPGWVPLIVDGLIGPKTIAARTFTPTAPTTLTQGQSFQGGIVNFDAQTGQRLNPGATTTLPQAIPPSNAGNINQTGNINLPQGNFNMPDTSGANSQFASSKSITENIQKENEKFWTDFAARQAAQNTNQSGILSSIMGNQRTATAITAEEEARYGVDAQAHLQKKQALEASYNSLNKDYTDAKNAMEAEKLAANDRMGTTGSISREQNAIERKYSPTLNRLASEANYKGAEIARENGNYNEAQELVQKAVNLKLADQKMNLDMNLALYKENQDSFDRMQGIYKDAFVSHINSLEKQYNEAQSNTDYVGKLSMTSDGALAGVTLNDTPEQAQEKIRRYQIANPPKSTTSTTPPNPTVITNTSGESLVYGTPEYVMERLKQTSGSTTKPVASEREQLGKFSNVVALTENLMGSLSKTTNDPVIGYLKSINPYDFDARAVNAQVTALVPSVARGLYGEVGVLTDSDIERYLQTLPNIRSTDDQNKFIAVMTLGNAKRSYEQTLLNLANSNVNVSGFVDSYKSLTDKITKLENEIGVGKETTQKVDDIFQSVVGTSTQNTPKSSNWIVNLWNKLF